MYPEPTTSFVGWRGWSARGTCSGSGSTQHQGPRWADHALSHGKADIQHEVMFETPPNRLVISWPRRLGWITLAVLLATLLPLFLCMPVWCDSTFFDMSAWKILRGEVLY